MAMGMEGLGIKGKLKGELGNRGAWGTGVQKDVGIWVHGQWQYFLLERKPM